MTENNDPNFVWEVESCTEKQPTDAYGEIEFAEDTSSKKPVSSIVTFDSRRFVVFSKFQNFAPANIVFLFNLVARKLCQVVVY